MPFKAPEWLHWYKKPSYVDVHQFGNALAAKAAGSNNTTPRTSVDTKRTSTGGDVPSKLSLERILKNKTCSPMSLYDFYMYLQYIEHSAENLEFYVWFKNYEQGRLTAFPELPRTRSLAGSDASFAKGDMDSSVKNVDNYMAESQDGTQMDDSELYERIASFIKPSLAGGSCAIDGGGCVPSPFTSTPMSSGATVGSSTTQVADAKSTELENIKKMFLLPSSPKELNIPARMRKKVLEAITHSTDAENLRPVAEHCYLLLKSCSHRNFIRLGVGNGTFETLCFATSLGIALMVTGLMTMLLLAFAAPGFRESSRWRGIGVWPMWFMGGGLLLSGLRGSCFFLLLFSRRQLLPWETYDDEKQGDSRPKKKKEEEKMNVWRFMSKVMVFDRKMRVKDDDLRRLQRKVVAQSLFGGFALSTIMVIVFLCLPIWKPL